MKINVKTLIAGAVAVLAIVFVSLLGHVDAYRVCSGDNSIRRH